MVESIGGGDVNEWNLIAIQETVWHFCVVKPRMGEAFKIWP